MSSDPLSSAAARIAEEAKRLRPWVYGLFVLSVVLIVSEIGSNGLSSTVHLREMRAAGEAFTAWHAVDAFLRQALQAAPVIALATALWYAQVYLRRLEAAEFWATPTTAMLKEVGSALVTSAVLSVLVVPTALLWLDRRGAFVLDLEGAPVVLGGLGLALIVISRALGAAQDAASALKADHDQIV